MVGERGVPDGYLVVDGYYKLGVYEEMTSNPDENGLQYLFHTKQPRVEIGDEVLFKGIVEFHEKY